MERLQFGTAGIPHAAKGKTVLEGFKTIKKLGLDGMEVEFVYGARMKQEEAAAIGSYISAQKLFATVHGPYYINLNSLEPKKVEASRERILKSARLGQMMGAKSVTFHAAFYMKQEPAKVYERVKKELATLSRKLKDEGAEIALRPELTGKPTQFGDLEEIIRLAKEVEGVGPCIDYSHYHARYGGNNSYEDFAATLKALKRSLGATALRQMHIHVSGIDYGEKGERKHLELKKSDFNYPELLKALADFKAGGWLICESPNLEEDALLLKEYYLSLV